MRGRRTYLPALECSEGCLSHLGSGPLDGGARLYVDFCPPFRRVNSHFDILISAALHRRVIAGKAIAAARAQLAECDSDAKAAGLDLKALRRATAKAQMTPADRRREADADAYVRLMQTVAFGACSEQPETGALSPTAPAETLTVPRTGEAA